MPISNFEGDPLVFIWISSGICVMRCVDQTVFLGMRLCNYGNAIFLRNDKDLAVSR